MAIEWGNTSGQMQVGIDIIVGAETNTYIEIRVDFYWRLVSGGPFNDGQNLHITGTGGTSDHSYHADTGTKLIAQRWHSSNKSYGGGPNWAWGVETQGAWNGGNPTHIRNFGVPARPAEPPGPPSWGVSGSNHTPTSVRLSWGPTTSSNGATPDNDELHVRRSSDNALVHQSIQPGNVRDVTGLEKGTSYYHAARIHNAAGWGPFSALTYTTTGTTVPGSPGIMSHSLLTATSFRLAYDAVTDTGGTPITGYEIQIATNASFTGATTVSDAGSPYDFTGLTRATPYYLRYRAVNAVGPGPWSGTGQVTTSQAVPGAPTGVAMSPVDADSTSVSWVAPSDNGGAALTGYEVQWSADASFATGSTVVPASASPLQIDGLTPGTAYYARVRALNSVGTGAYSTSASTTTLQGVKFWNGTAFVNGVVYYWDGTGWLIPAEVRYWDGDSFELPVG